MLFRLIVTIEALGYAKISSKYSMELVMKMLANLFCPVCEPCILDNLKISYSP
jgi:hypothetical protein